MRYTREALPSINERYEAARNERAYATLCVEATEHLEALLDRLASNGIKDAGFRDADDVLDRLQLERYSSQDFTEERVVFSVMQIIRGARALLGAQGKAVLQRSMQQEMDVVVMPADEEGDDHAAHAVPNDRAATPYEELAQAAMMVEESGPEVTVLSDSEMQIDDLPVRSRRRSRRSTVNSRGPFLDDDSEGDSIAVEGNSTNRLANTTATPQRSATLLVAENLVRTVSSGGRRSSGHQSTSISEVSGPPVSPSEQRSMSAGHRRQSKKQKTAEDGRTNRMANHERDYEETLHIADDHRITEEIRLSDIIRAANEGNTTRPHRTNMAHVLMRLFDPAPDMVQTLQKAAESVPLQHDAKLERQLDEASLGQLKRLIGDPNGSFGKPKHIYQAYQDLIALCNASDIYAMLDSPPDAFVLSCIERFAEDGFTSVVACVLKHGGDLPMDRRQFWVDKIKRKLSTGRTLRRIQQSFGDGAIVLLSGQQLAMTKIPKSTEALQESFSRLKDWPQLIRMFGSFLSQLGNTDFKQPWTYNYEEEMLAVCLAKHDRVSQDERLQISINAINRIITNGTPRSRSTNTATGPATADMTGAIIVTPGPRSLFSNTHLFVNEDGS